MRQLTACVSLAVLFLMARAQSVRCEEAQLRSPALVPTLIEAMSSHGLDAIAARDPASSDRFIAAIAMPGSQLLVVEAPYAAPADLDSRIVYGQYRAVYSLLQQPSVRDGKIFVQDLGCDGLGGEGAMDILYEHETSRLVLDGDWKTQHLSEQAYKTRLHAADETYSHMLSVLIDAAKNAVH